MMILGFKNSALAVLLALTVSVSAAPASTSPNSSVVQSGLVAVPNGLNRPQSNQTAPKIQLQPSAKKLDERNADYLNVNLRDVSGQNTTLRQWFQTNTKPVLVVLSATWCPPCMHELPLLASMQKTLADKLDVLIVFVDEMMTSDPKNPQLQPKLQKFHRGTESLRLYYAADALAVMKKNKLFGIPSFLLFSPSGSIVYVSTGAKNWDSTSVQQELLSHIKKMDESKNSPPKASKHSPIKTSKRRKSVATSA
ncbi:MAG: TlpA family protein disulfide reductase [Alphaproteobacteria bacterium]|nr:TlpA family protein disulfide reductase [Alphaproteobacteria bacterium]